VSRTVEVATDSTKQQNFLVSGQQGNSASWEAGRGSLVANPAVWVRALTSLHALHDPKSPAKGRE